MLLKNQADISAQTPLPVENVDNGQKVVSASEALVQFYYYNAGVLTADAGQAINSLVVAKLGNGSVLNAIGSCIATKNDTSLSFISTAFTTPSEIDWSIAEKYAQSSGATLLQELAGDLPIGGYVVDYRTGTIYGKKASVQTSLTTVAYKYASASATLVTGDIAIGAVEIKDGSTDQRATVNSSGELKVTSSPSTIADYKSPSDFTAAFTTASTITLTGLPINVLTGVQVVYVRVKATGATGSTNTYVNGSSGYSFYYVQSTGVLTALKDNVATSIFAASDSYEVGINANTKAYDLSTDTLKVSNTNPDSNKYVQDSLVDDTTATVLPTGGNDCTVTITVDSEGRVTGGTIVAAGTGYTNATGTAYYLIIIGGNNDCVFSYTLSGSTVGAITLVRPGSGYTAATGAATAVCSLNYYPSTLGMAVDGYKNISCSGKVITAAAATAYATVCNDVTNDEDPTNADWVQVAYTKDTAGTSAGQTKNAITVNNGTMIWAHSLMNCNYSYFRKLLILAGATANTANTKIIKVRRNN